MVVYSEHILVTRRGIAADLQNPETRALHKAVDKVNHYVIYKDLGHRHYIVQFAVNWWRKKLSPFSMNEDNQSRQEHLKDMKTFLLIGRSGFQFALDYSWVDRWRNEQSKLRLIFEKQEKQGGIIDLEAEKQKNLVTEETVGSLIWMFYSN